MKNDLSNHGKDWTSEDIFDLLDCTNKGIKVTKIAAILKRSPTAVYNKQNELAGDLMREKRITLEIIEKRDNGKKVIQPVEITFKANIKHVEEEEDFVDLLDDDEVIDSEETETDTDDYEKVIPGKHKRRRIIA